MRMHYRALGLVLALGLTSSLITGAAQAQEDDPATLEAREHFKAGVAAFDNGDYEAARTAFLKAYALKKHEAVLLNLANSELMGRRYVDAARHFREYLNEHDSTNTEATAGLAKALEQVGQLKLSTDVSGATLRVDGDVVGKTPLEDPVLVDPGDHVVRASKDTLSVTKRVSVSAGEETSLDLTLTPKATEPTPVAEGGGPEPEPDYDTDEEFTADSRGFFDWVGDTPAAWVGLGITGAGLVGSGVFAFLANRKYDNANATADVIRSEFDRDKESGSPYVIAPDTAPCKLDEMNFQRRDGDEDAAADRRATYADACSVFVDQSNAGDTNKTLAIVSGVVGGVAAAGTLIVYFVDTSGDADRAGAGSLQARVIPLLSPELSGLGVVGTF